MGVLLHILATRAESWDQPYGESPLSKDWTLRLRQWFLVVKALCTGHISVPGGKYALCRGREPQHSTLAWASPTFSTCDWSTRESTVAFCELCESPGEWLNLGVAWEEPPVLTVGVRNVCTVVSNFSAGSNSVKPKTSQHFSLEILALTW